MQLGNIFDSTHTPAGAGEGKEFEWRGVEAEGLGGGEGCARANAGQEVQLGGGEVQLGSSA